VPESDPPHIMWHGQVLPAAVEIVNLGEVETSVEVPAFADPWLRRFIAALVASERIEGANRIAPVHVIEMAARRYLEQGGTIGGWQRYEAELGVTKSKTRPPRSAIQPFVRWCFGGKPDRDGRLARISAAFDAWLAIPKSDRPDPTPRDGEPGTSQLAEWLRREGGYVAVAAEHSGQNYSESMSEIALPVGTGKARPKGEAKYLALRATAGSEEWYAPVKIFTAMNVVFDLDPASPGKDIVHWVPANRYFTKVENGLKSDWGNNFVWLNPPHSRKGLPQWIEKFQRHNNGVLLCVDRTSTKWWQNVASNADMILQVNKKIHFINPEKDPTNHNALGSSLIAYGPIGIEALVNAARNGLGTLFVPYAKFQVLTTKRTTSYSDSNSENVEPAAPLLQGDETPPSAEAKETQIAELKARITALEAENATLKARIDELTG